MLKKYTLLGIFTLLFVSVIAACSSTSKNETVEKKTQRPIMIQGPMPIEAENFAKKLENVKEEKSGDFVFYIGTLDNYPCNRCKNR